MQFSDNPYYNYRAVSDPEMFFGRDEELQDLFEACVKKQSVSLVGPRHIGKTSIFMQIKLPAIQQRFQRDLSHILFVFIDFRDYLERTRDDFFRSVCEQIVLQGQPLISDLHITEKRSEEQFSDLLQALEQAGFHPILLMDAFDRVTGNPHFDLAFFSFLRSQATRGRVSYFTASIRPLVEVSSPLAQDSPFFNIFINRPVGPLTSDAARQLITEPACKIGCAFSLTEARWIISRAGCHPFFVQVACRLLFDEKRRSQDGEIDLGAVQERLYAELLPHFDQIWASDMSVERKRELIHEAWRQSDDNRKVSELSESLLFRRHIRETFQIERFDITVKDIRDALDNLSNFSFLQKSPLSDLHYIYLRAKQARSSAGIAQRKGQLINDMLKTAFERLKPGGVRSDVALEWRSYNILYYHYFRHHLQNEQTAARLNISSRRQFYREQDKAIQALLDEVLAMEADMLRESEG